MDDPVPRHSAQEILEHLDWVRTLAGVLCRDAVLADDVTQETALAALRRPPSAELPLRSWLGGVVRNLASKARRGERRRRDREEVAAREASVPSTLELLEKVSLERRVVDAVLALREPYRTTVLLRYFEELAPPEVARRTGLPEATVKTRLRRALGELRASLDERFGGERRTWLLALAPLAAPRASAPAVPAGGPLVGPLATGALLMNAKTIALSMSLFAVAATGGAWWLATPERIAEPVATAARPARAALAAPAPLVVADAAGPVRAAVPAPPPTAERPKGRPAHVATGLPFAIEGSVIDTRGAGVAGAELRQGNTGEPGSVVAVSGPEGHFRLETTVTAGNSLFVEDEDWTTVMDAMPAGFRNDPVPHVVVVAPRRLVEGEVVDPGGQPLEGVELEVRPTADLRRHLAAKLDRSRSRSWNAESDAAGTFRFGPVPDLVPAHLHARKVGYRSASLELDPGDRGLRVVLEPVGDEPDVLVGRVLDAQREPVEGAWVSLGQRSVQSGPRGEFQLETQGWEASRTLTAVRSGSLPGRLERAPDEDWPSFVELVLGATPHSIRGRVVDALGNPVPGAQLRLIDATLFGFLPLGMSESSFALGQVESMLRGDDGTDTELAADADGRFTIPGLLDRSYRLLVAHPATLASVKTEPIRATRAGGREIEVRIPGPERVGPLHGRLLSHGGRPLVGITVQPNLFHDGGGEASPFMNVRGAQTTTDEEGRFSFARLVYDDLHLGLYGGAILSYENHVLDPTRDTLHYDIVLRERCHFLVQLGERPDRADSFQLLDEDDAPLQLSQGRGDYSLATDSAHLSAGRSEVYTGPEGASTLRLLLGEEEVERVPIVLVPGEVNRIGL